jgi:isocitrate/isopropylmalate dehydrogenase
VGSLSALFLLGCLLTSWCCSKVRTRDMGGESTTHDFTRAILDKMDAMA